MLDGSERICERCVGDAFLRSLMKDRGPCFACASDVSCTMSLSEFAERLRRALAQFYMIAAPGLCFEGNGGNCADSVEDLGWREKLETDLPEVVVLEQHHLSCTLIDVLCSEVALSVSTAEAVASYLSTAEDFGGPQTTNLFDGSYRFVKREFDGQGWHDLWDEVQLELKSKARFFSKKANRVFDAVFGDLVEHSTIDGRPIIRKLEAGFPLYRARVFQDDGRLKSALESPARFLGPPSANASAGRMNAHGVSVFYGATAKEVALTEVRPPVGAKVAIAKFILNRELSVLDLTSLGGVRGDLSIFDAGSLSRVERAAFLRTFCKKIVMPVMPDQEATEYLITQAAAEYLAYSERLQLDGIIYPSSQISNSREVNVVLFNKSARSTGSADTRFNVKIEQWGDERVIALEPCSGAAYEQTSDEREQMLRLDEGALVVATVTGVTFSFEPRGLRQIR